MNEWLSERADALATGTGVDRNALELSPEEIDTLLELVGFAAHDSGARAGVASLHEPDEIVRSTS